MKAPVARPIQPLADFLALKWLYTPKDLKEWEPWRSNPCHDAQLR